MEYITGALYLVVGAAMLAGLFVASPVAGAIVAYFVAVAAAAYFEL